MTGLLISVRNANEASLAVAGGADVIDVKEPRRGALGAPTRRALNAVSQVVGGRLPLSVAMGELGDDVDHRSLLNTSGLVYAKVGLARAGAEWRKQWTSLCDLFPQGVRPVAVAYADHHGARSPCPRDVLHVARRLECRALLIDTYAKGCGGLLDLLTLSELHDLVGRAQEMGMLAVVGGSLDGDSMSRVLGVGPDYVAIRGAACRGGREGQIDLQRVHQLAKMVHGAEATRADPAVRV